MSDDAVKAKTRRAWAQWVQALDRVDASSWPTRDIARYLADHHALSGWWSQTVTVGYERIPGLRDIGQRRGGGYEASKSKTIAVPIGKLYKAFSDKRQRARWLPNVDLTVRTATREKSMRITWSDGTPVDVHFTKEGSTKSLVSVQHRKLPSKIAAAWFPVPACCRLVELSLRRRLIRPHPPDDDVRLEVALAAHG